MYNGIFYDQIMFNNSLPGEQWLPITELLIPDINPYYYISNKGRVWSTFINGVMATHPTPKGYIGAILSRRSTRQGVNIMIHRVEMLLFNWIPGCELLEVNHRDGKKDNNDITNLEWMTSSENQQHAYDNGLKPKGELHGNAIHTEEQVRRICEGLECGFTLKECAKRAGLEINHTNEAFVSSIKHKIIWTDISDEYEIPDGDNSQLFSDTDVHIICKMMEDGLSNEEIVETLCPEISKSQYKNVMNSIRKRTRLTRISKNYNF